MKLRAWSSTVTTGPVAVSPPHLAVADQGAGHLAAAGEAEVGAGEGVDGAGEAGRGGAAGADEAVPAAAVGVDAAQLHLEVGDVGPLAGGLGQHGADHGAEGALPAEDLEGEDEGRRGLAPVDLGEQAAVPAGAGRVEDEHRTLEGEGRLVWEVDPHRHPAGCS